jgi:colanic acid/amylovoran biosynthesis glycosyltransferase
MSKETLLVLPSMDIGQAADGRIRLTEKFVTGMQMYLDQWHGSVAVLAQQDASAHSGNLDDAWYRPGDLPFQVTVAPFDSTAAHQVIAGAAVVQGGADHRLGHMPALCAALGARYVFVSEYTLRTRWQIIDAEKLHPLVAWRRKLWAWRQERVNVAAVKASAAVHCNGTPTFDAYQPLNAQSLLYFDSRVTPDMLPEVPRVAVHPPAWSPSSPMRLAFSGRLNAMKGADHLVLVARELRVLGVPFTLDIYGDGPLVPSLKAAIQEHGLEDVVRLGGVLDFASELMPTVRDQVDLFVCCHRQGDPSCTYLETMACGVPIVGYANEAFQGLMQRCDAGISVTMNDAKALASAIGQLHRNPQRLANMAGTALTFARQHTFEQEFRRRIDHMQGLLVSDAQSQRLP